MTSPSSADEEIVSMKFTKVMYAFALSLLLFLSGELPLTKANWFIQSLSSGLFLDDPSGSQDRGTIIQQYHRNGGGLNQQWEIVDMNNGYFVIVNEESGKVLDVPGFSTDDNVLIQQWTFNGGFNQQWEFNYDDSTGAYEIMNANSGKVLDVPGSSNDDHTQIQQYHGNGGANQRWVLYPNP
jgi:glucosylceramidase